MLVGNVDRRGDVRAFHRQIAVGIRVCEGDVDVRESLELNVIQPTKSVVRQVTDDFEGLGEACLLYTSTTSHLV